MTRIQLLCENYSVRSISWWRALAMVIDYLFCGAIIVALAGNIDSITALTAIVLGFIILYFSLSETIYGKTIGKKLCKLAVVDVTGNKPKFWQSLIRTLTRVLELNPKLLGPGPAAVSLLVSKKKQRIGDLLARTYVVRDIDLLGESAVPESDYKNINANRL